jgi:selenocysteine lyase/cysteine desulfurase
MPEPSSSSGRSAAECYRCWTAYDALCQAVAETNYRSVWHLLSCQCCPEPHCWQTSQLLPVREIPEPLKSRIRWYDSVQLPSAPPSPSHSTTAAAAPCTSVATATGAPQSNNALSQEKIRALQDHFVSHHQRIELVLHCLRPSLDRIYELLEPHRGNSNNNLDDEISAETLQQVLVECRYSANGWYSVGQLVRGVALLDRMEYLMYVPRLAGVSGGNSPLMMPLTAKTGNLENLLFPSSTTTSTSSSTSQIADMALAIQNRTPTGQLAEAFVDCLDALSRCWFEHVVTATTAIGITRGTKGTPNAVLVERVCKRLHASRLLLALGSLRAPITGIGVEMHQLCNYSHYPLADHYLDLFVDPGPEFGTHNVGWQPKEYERARAAFGKIRRTQRTGIWQYFYQDIRPAFCVALRQLLGLQKAEQGSLVSFGLGSSVTEVLSRLTTTIELLVGDDSMDVILSDDEFVTMQRAAAILGRGGANIQSVRSNEIAALACIENSHDEKKDNLSTVTKLVFVSLVNSCTQRVQPLDWVSQVSPSTVVVIDITQAVGNIPLSPCGIADLASRPNVFFVGSLIKHARCGEGLGFVTYYDGPDRLLNQPASGWASYCSGLRDNTTADLKTNALYYDEGTEWDGGTPSWVEAAYVATRILKVMPSVEEQHSYVQRMQALFLEQAQHLLLSDSQRQVAAAAAASRDASNTLAVPVRIAQSTSTLPPTLPFGLDYKVVNGTTTYLRIGFGVHNLDYHIPQLVQVLEETNALG